MNTFPSVLDYMQFVDRRIIFPLWLSLQEAATRRRPQIWVRGRGQALSWTLKLPDVLERQCCFTTDQKPTSDTPFNHFPLPAGDMPPLAASFTSLAVFIWVVLIKKFGRQAGKNEAASGGQRVSALHVVSWSFIPHKQDPGVSGVSLWSFLYHLYKGRVTLWSLLGFFKDCSGFLQA